jgi:hypothetical protein
MQKHLTSLSGSQVFLHLYCLRDILTPFLPLGDGMRSRNLDPYQLPFVEFFLLGNLSTQSNFSVFVAPLDSADLATKQYVDLQTAAYSVDTFNSGTIGASVLPAFTGDLTKGVGESTVSLGIPTVVSAETTYSRLTIGPHGFATSAEQLLGDDIPDFPWSKITTGKPITAAGYGIVNALATSGGTMTGPISVSNLATLNYSNGLHTVPRAKVDEKESQIFTAQNTYATGRIRQITSPVTPLGFLRNNGGLVYKSDYPALYATVGDRFNPYGFTLANSNKPWCSQYDINTLQSSDITGWVTNTPLPFEIQGAQVIVTKNRVYLIGGRVTTTHSAPSTAVYMAPINSDGGLGTWAMAAPIPAAIYLSHIIVIKNRVYLLGGIINYDPAGSVYSAPINPDGTLGVWTIGAPLPLFVDQSQAVVTNTRIYLLGGRVNGGPSSTVYTAPINTDGTLGAWSTGTALPAVTHAAQIAVVKDRVHLLGGIVNNVASSSVHTSIVNADGTLGSWTVSPSLPAAVSHSHTFVTRNRVYLLGGGLGPAVTNLVYTAPVNADGSLGAWSAGTALPGGCSNGHLIVTENKIHLLGGMTSAGPSAAFYTATISGGLNDYMLYFDQDNSVTPADQFTLPTLALAESLGLFSYIKT